MATTIKELCSFGQGVLKDFIAVQNAVNLPWSNGQVEGQVNKLTKRLRCKCLVEPALIYYERGWYVTRDRMLPPNLTKNHFTPKYSNHPTKYLNHLRISINLPLVILQNIYAYISNILPVKVGMPKTTNRVGYY